MNNYQELKIWNKSMDLVVQVYALTKSLPEEERFGLISQLKRCSISIPSNIAEGAGRNSEKDFIRFLSIANGSTTELETQLILTNRLGFFVINEIEKLLNLCSEIKKMNFALQRSLKSS
ncbi:MAG: four helix bundle protein [Aquimarina sp.]|nr:four helix bundle protein [Aquimarina sp.]